MNTETLQQENRWFILAAVACGTFMATLDSSIVNVALPTITGSLNTDLFQSRWVIISYLFTITALLLFFGKLGDIIGRKPIFLTGFSIFTLGSGLCGLADLLQSLVAFRTLQGLGACMLMANGPAIITAAFKPQERGRALGTLAMIVSAGLAIGPSVGGFILRYLGWQYIFLVNLPVGVLGFLLAFKHLPDDRYTDLTKEYKQRMLRLPIKVRFHRTFSKLRYFDWLGAGLWVFIQLGYSISIDVGNRPLFNEVFRSIIALATLGFFILFLIWESSIDEPILNMSLFQSKVFRNSNISALFNIIGMSSLTFLTPFYLHSVQNRQPVEVGLLMTVIPLSIFISAPIAGRLADQFGSRILAITGMCFMSSSLLLMGSESIGLKIDSPSGNIALYLILAGFGVGIFQSPNSKTILGDVPKAHLGVASALLATIRNFGIITGTAISSTLLMWFFADYCSFGHGDSQEYCFLRALKDTLTCLGILCSCGVVSSYFNRGIQANKGPSEIPQGAQVGKQ